MRNYIDPDELPKRQVVIRFRFSDPGLEYDTYWALVRPGVPIEICSSIPGFDVDLYVETDRFSISSILLGRTTIAREIEESRLFMSGDALLARTMKRWFYRREKDDPSDVLMLEQATL